MCLPHKNKKILYKTKPSFLSSQNRTIVALLKKQNVVIYNIIWWSYGKITTDGVETKDDIEFILNRKGHLTEDHSLPERRTSSVSKVL